MIQSQGQSLTPLVKEKEEMAMKHDKLHGLQEPYQVLKPDGELRHRIGGEVDEALMIKMYENMMHVRMFDRKAVNLQRQGRIGTYAPYEGQEAAQVGSAMALSPEDWLFPSYRDHAATITHGQSLSRVLLYWMGHMEGSVSPEGLKIMPPCVPIATQLVHAVGTSWAAKLKGEKQASIAYFGEGATSEGDFHEALNFAGVYQTATIFFCQNNGYAISVPFHAQSASRTIAQRAAAYDIAGVRVDGNDIFAVWLTVREAIKRGLAGGGPTLVEAVTFRYGAHTTSDDPRKYRDQERLASEWREQRDPVHRLRLFLQKRGLWNEKDEERMLERLTGLIEDAVSEAESYPKSRPADMFKHVFADVPWSIDEQQKQSGLCMEREGES
ncbi:pyruvate dehydrogenase E1 component subunit alpha [Paenibacillus larvae subsp. larvae]|uniref:Pyruvate dehydrogenase E1 component subunit alpha n=3 Tax=Paenibacillus larvae TaxID=1464 RepID=A0A6C0QW27_9BACL|nr:pyruvate dehydrogenase E1 component subunit alpha [Paenibacillus larvae subsp. larvae]